ncbi:hypothetical protein [Methylobacterium nigriterrae]|uniref:hypothetical protein n=1 Tax=Methylobacterium nigriterrae TaxID=3127512 RepID=UPI0030137092
MESSTSSLSCPFIQRLVAALAEDLSDSPRQQDEMLLKLLLALELEAEDGGAAEASQIVIARALRLAGIAACKSASLAAARR